MYVPAIHWAHCYAGLAVSSPVSVAETIASAHFTNRGMVRLSGPEWPGTPAKGGHQFQY